MDRRDFVTNLVNVVGGLGVASIVPSCGTGSVPSEPPPAGKGNVDGLVTDLDGNPVPSLGRVILMFASGRQVGLSANPDARARFSFVGLAPGEYQVRYHAPGQAFVPEPFPHPIRFRVEADGTVPLHVPVRVGPYNINTVEIYCGDGFFQLQPDGIENGEAVVARGINVCWYNVGVDVHSITGGPWLDSGDLQRTQAYLWTANQTGTFGYQCRHHGPDMRAVLRVV